MSGYHRSPSQLGKLLSCGEQFRLERLVKPKPPKRPASWLALGIAVHEALAQWERSGRESDPLKEYDLLYDQEITNLLEDQPDLEMWQKPFRTKSVENDITNRKVLGFRQVNNYVEDALASPWELWYPNEDEPAVEIEFEMMLGEVQVVGAIDIIIYWPNEKQYVVRDLKTGNREVRLYQLGTYGLAAKKIFGLDIEYAEYFYLKDRGSSGFLNLKRYSEEYLTNIYRMMDEQIQRGLLMPNPGDSCGTCAVKEYCRELGSDETYW